MDYPKKGGLGSGTDNPLLGRDLLIKMGAQIHVGPERVEVLFKNGPIHVLTLAPEEEYKLFPQPAPSPSPLLQRFLSEVPKVWAEKKQPNGTHSTWGPSSSPLKAGAPQPESGNTQCPEFCEVHQFCEGF